jgi:hypothetical protein
VRNSGLSQYGCRCLPSFKPPPMLRTSLLVYGRICLRLQKTPTTTSRKNFSGSVVPPGLPQPLASSFKFWPTFLSIKEQQVLLRASLQRLDAMDSVPTQRKRRKHLSSCPVQPNSADLQGYFAPDELYDFHEVQLKEMLAQMGN